MSLLVALAIAGQATAAELDDGEDTSEPLQFHAFVSQGFIKSTGNNYLTDSKRGSFEFNEVGVNLTKTLGERLRLGIQLFGRDLGPIGNYTARLDWFYFDYRFFDWLGIRAGRTKLPFGLYNEINDIDSARVPILLPQAVYPIVNRDLLLAQTGVEIYGYRTLGPVGALDYRAYGGTIYVDTPTSSPPLELTSFKVPYLVGGRLMWETPLDGLRVGGSYQALRFDADYSLSPGAPPLFTGLAKVSIPFRLWLTSIEYAAHDLLLAAEYGRWSAHIDSNVPKILPPTRTTNERFYGMASYRFTPWLAPGFYYSAVFPNVDDRHGRDAYQHDLAATVRFDINAYLIFKIEGHFVRGTSDLDPHLNDQQPMNLLQKDWTYFLAKATAYF